MEGRHFHLAYLNLLAGIGSVDSSGNCDGAAILSKYKEVRLRTSIDLVSVENDGLAEVAERWLPFVDVLFANCFEIGQISGSPTVNETNRMSKEPNRPQRFVLIGSLRICHRAFSERSDGGGSGRKCIFAGLSANT